MQIGGHDRAIRPAHGGRQHERRLLLEGPCRRGAQSRVYQHRYYSLDVDQNASNPSEIMLFAIGDGGLTKIAPL